MASRDATVEIAKFKKNGKIVFRLWSASIDYDEMYDYSDLEVDATALPRLDHPENVAAYGSILRTALYGDQAVGSELEQIFGTAKTDRTNLRFRIGPVDGEQFRWETLFKEGSEFLAAGGTCSFRRVAFAGSREIGVRVFQFPIKIAAFLSPIGVESEKEFRAIASAVEAARANGLDVQATCYLGEQDLIVTIDDEVRAGKLVGIKVEPMPTDAFAIEKALLEDPVQILHFFCHGQVSANVQLLEFASINDHDTEAPIGSINLSVERLKEILTLSGTVWLTVLNSCSSAREVPRLYSIARALAQSASPFTVGMAEPITDTDATLFAGGLYMRAFEIIRDAVEGLQEGSASTIDLGPAVAHARMLLHEAGKAGKPEAFSRWCLPILYERAESLRVVRDGNPETQVRVESIAQALRAMSASTPPEIREQVLALLDKDPPVPDALRPDRFGNFA